MTHQHSHFITLTPAVTASNLTQKQYQDIQTDSHSVTLSTSFAMEQHLTLQFLNAGDTTACAWQYKLYYIGSKAYTETR